MTNLIIGLLIAILIVCVLILAHLTLPLNNAYGLNLNASKFYLDCKIPLGEDPTTYIQNLPSYEQRNSLEIHQTNCYVDIMEKAIIEKYSFN